MALRAHSRPMFTLAFIAARHAMRRRLIGARLDDPVLPEPSAGKQRAGKPVDGRRSAERGPHVALIPPKPARSNEDLV